jgi:hypothetical protein
MPNGIKYSTGTTEAGCLRKGNMLISNNTADTGATFFTGINPPTNGYTIYLNKASGGPSIYCPANDTQLINITNRNIAGTVGSPAGYTTVAQCLEYFATQTDKLCVNFNYEGIVTNGLMLNYDAGFDPSYPTIGSTWYDLSGNSNNGTLINNPAFNSANSGSIVWDGVDDYVNTGKTATQLGFYDANYTMEAWVYPTDLSNDRTMFGTDQGGFRTGLHLIFRGGNIYQGHYASDFNAGTVTVNNWYQIVYTFNASNGACQIFKNSVSQGTGTISSFIGTTNVLIARWGIGTNFIGNGGIYRIYNRVLSSSEISQNYNAQKGRFGL